MSIIGSNILAGASGQGGGGYTIENSLRFRSSASAYLNRTSGTPTSGSIFTHSFWVKRGILGTQQTLISGQRPTNFDRIYFDSNNTLFYQWNDGASNLLYLQPTQVFRDPSAWYHIVVSTDTTQATASNRVKFYINGVQVTALTSTTYPTQNSTSYLNRNSTTLNLGRTTTAAFYLDGYLTEVNFIDGQALDPSDFGNYNATTGVWQPVAYAGTYGTNGFYLPFSDATNTTTLVADSSGNGNDWTPNNISLTSGVTYDSMTDTPTIYAGGGNYAVLNPLFKPSGTNPPTFSEGNLKAAPNAGAYQNTFSTIGASSGKWYAELLCGGTPNSANYFGVSSAEEVNYLAANAGLIGNTSTGYSIRMDTGDKRTNSVNTSYGTGFVNGDIMQFALDLDNSKVYFGKNGTWFASGDPVAGTNAAFTGFSGTFFIGGALYSGGFSSAIFNFGQRPFAYTPPTGFLPLHTGNLPDSAIVDGSQYFNAVLYTGASAGGTTSQNITGVGFQPDFLWIKARSNAGSNCLADVVRGGNKQLFSNLTNAEQTDSNIITSLNADGFTVGNNSTGTGSTNQDGYTYASWNWKANGAGVSNTDGSITSTVSANPTSGFSIVTYTGNYNGSSGTGTLGHGLNTTPSLIIIKNRDSAYDWAVGHSSVGWTQAGSLNLPNTFGTSSYFNSTAPTASVFSVGQSNITNQNLSSHVAYCFAEVEGYSKTGKWQNNNSTDGAFVYLGFRPRFILLKNYDNAESWYIWDSVRQTYNVPPPSNNWLSPRLPNSEAANSVTTAAIDGLSNGFKIRTTNPASGEVSFGTRNYIYMAFAENPFKNALAR
jgi:hypothetical protein